MREARQEVRRARQVVGRARQAAPLLLFLLAGCGSDRPYTPPPGHAYRPSTPAAKPTATAEAAVGPPDPLIGDTRQAAADPLLGRDPLLGSDSLRGRAMPTQHSHWLRGRLHDARVTVLLNGVWYGSFSGALDRDITMSLRQGANTVKFVYQPNAPASAGALEIVEGEHHPPLAPLVTFRSQSAPAASAQAVNDDPLKPVTQTFPFIAN